MTQVHDSRAVANEILQIATRKHIPITIMQLIKLTFFANGWSLALRDTPLTNEIAEAWQHGPVFPLIYKSYRGIGSMPLSEPIKDRQNGIEISENFTAEEKELLESIVDGYGTMHAFELSQLTHTPNSPWSRTVHDKGYFSLIPNEVIKEYFNALNDDETRSIPY